jgi:hypothetical protein
MTTRNKAKSKNNQSRFTLPVDRNLATKVWVGQRVEKRDDKWFRLILETKALDPHGLVTDRPAAIRDVQITIRLLPRYLKPSSIEIEATPFYCCGLHHKVTRHMKTTRRAYVKGADNLEIYLRGVTQLLTRLEPRLPVTPGGYADILYRNSFFAVTEVTFPLSVIASVANRRSYEEIDNHNGYGRSDLVDGYWFRWEIAAGSKILKRLSSLLLCNNGAEEQLT